MNNIFVSTDWHLYSDKLETRHPYRSIKDLEQLHDHIGEGMTQDDLWIFLGDLCDPKSANLEQLRRILNQIPATKVLIRGNHDTEDDQWYLDLGFDLVADELVIHNLLFSHKPRPVPEDWINIHGHIHHQSLARNDGRHINTYASNWYDTCHAAPLDDLVKRSRTDSTKLDPHSMEKMDKYLKEDGPMRRIDLSDRFDLYPMDEAVNRVQDSLKDIQRFNDELTDWDYAVWNGAKLIKNPTEKDYKNYRTLPAGKITELKGGTCWDYTVYEYQEFRRRWPRVPVKAWNIYFEDTKNSPSHAFITFQPGANTHMLFEASDKQHAGLWIGDSEQDILSKCFLWLAETNRVPITKPAWISQFRPVGDDWCNLKVQEYMDRVAENAKPWKIDPTAVLTPYTVSKGLTETVTPINEYLFPDVEMTKYFETDDAEFQRKEAKAAVDQKADSVVTLDQ